MATSSLLRGSVRLGAPARLRRCARSAVRVAAAAETKPELVATSVTLTKLKESAGGKMTKNVDGALLSRACLHARVCVRSRRCRVLRPPAALAPARADAPAVWLLRGATARRRRMRRALMRMRRNGYNGCARSEL
jgi:hypothetical protein